MNRIAAVGRSAASIANGSLSLRDTNKPHSQVRGWDAPPLFDDLFDQRGDLGSACEARLPVFVLEDLPLQY